MSDGVFNIAKGAWAEKVRDSDSDLLVLLLTTSETETTLVDYDTVAALLAGTPVESAFTNYARKTGITGTLTVDDSNDRVDLDMPDQTWTSAGNGSNETTAKLIVAYQESAADSGRIPLSHHDFVVTTDGSDVTAQINASGILRAS